MANQRRGLLQIATEIQREGQPAGAGVYNGTAVDPGVSQLGNTAAGVFGDISAKVGAIADHAAKIEGGESGRVAGLDPEFRTRRDMTIRGEAFDAAGLDVYRSQMRQGIEAEVTELSDKSGEDTGAVQSGVAKLRAKWGGQVPVELRPDVELIFNRSEAVLMREAARKHAMRVTAEQKAAVETDIADGLKGLHQRAFALGLDPGADNLLAKDVGELRRVLGRKGLNGQALVTPAQAAKLLRGVEQDVADARLLGAFDRVTGLTAKRAFIDKVEADFAGSKGLSSVYDMGQFRQITGLLKREYARAESAERAVVAAVKNELRRFEGVAKKGFSLPPHELAGLRARISQSGSAELAAGFDIAETLLKRQRARATLPPQQLDALLEGQRAAMKSGGASPAMVADLEAGDALLSEMRTGLKRDPLSWAEQTGLMTIQPVRWGETVQDGSGSGEIDLAAMDLRQRRAQAEAVAARYGQAPRYFTENDRAQLAQIATAGGTPLVRIATTLAEGFGDKADEAFKEIASAGKLKGGNVMAALGGLVKNNANPAVIQDVANGLALRRVPEFKSVAPKMKDANPVFSLTFGAALRGLPATSEVLRDMANAVYDVRAKRDNVTEFDGDMYQDIVKELSGEVEMRGNKFGGIGWHRAGFFDGATERKVLVPPGVAQGRFDDLIGLITNADLEGTGQVPYDVKGNILKADTVRRGTYVSAGSNRYRIALGDLETDPQWLHDKAGRPLLFDLGILLPRLKKRQPDLFLGGR